MRALMGGLMVAAIWTAAQAAPFTYVPGPGTTVTLVDQGSISAVDGLKAFWSYVFSNPLKPTPTGLFYVAFRTVVDCEGQRLRTLAAVSYDIQNQIVFSSGAEKEWESNPPESLGGQEVIWACRGAPLSSGRSLEVADVNTFVSALREAAGIPTR